MDARIIEFLDKATVVMLKSKLQEMNLATTGHKATLLLRLEEAVKDFSSEEIARYFPEPANINDSDESRGLDETKTAEIINVDEELESLRELVKKKREIIDLKSQLAALSCDERLPSSSPAFHYSDIEESLNSFSGEDKYSIEKWVQQFEEAAEVFGWSDKARFVYGRRLLSGTAKLFLRTISVKSWFELKNALMLEFSRKVTAAEVHDELRKRKRKKDESWQQYLFTMQEIASSANIDESDVIRYVINGIEDSVSNKMILFNANTIQELKIALQKYERMKSCQSNQSSHTSNHRRSQSSAETKNKSSLKCYNCNQPGHVIAKCPQPRREKGSCFRCGKNDHRIKDCTQKSLNAVDEPFTNSSSSAHFNYPNNFERFIKYSFEAEDKQSTYECSVLSLLDSGSPISLVQEQFLPPCMVQCVDSAKYNYCGINGSVLCIIGLSNVKVHFNNSCFYLKIHVVKNFSMMYPIILGRNFLELSNLELREKEEEDNETRFEDENGVDKISHASVEGSSHSFSRKEDFLKQILNIEVSNNNDVSTVDININSNLPYDIQDRVKKIIKPACFPSVRKVSNSFQDDFEMEIRVTNDKPFFCTPRRLPYVHKVELQKILNDLQERGVIRESNSPYASPIVLVKKKNNELRLCVDYRELNKVTVRDNFPIPLIEDHLSQLKNKKYFSVLDLKNGFYHVKIAENSVKYTSFVTPLGQFEFLRMPFGLKNAPAVFEKFMKRIFKPLISTGKVLSYIDDLLIATEEINEHIDILKQIIDIVVANSLQLRLDKCSFLFEQIVYLGYKVTYNGIQPNEEHLRAVRDFPQPKCRKSVQSFLGLASYFRKFIKDFAITAKPLYDLMKKDQKFSFGRAEMKAFETLKLKLLEAPVLEIYSPDRETQLHCDASSIGFGAILMQKQRDGKFHPVAYFSKRVSEPEKNYHSFELETLSIIYALRRFHVYLIGIKFKIITDCQALALTLNRKYISPRISRWTLELQNYDYVIEHRGNSKMSHADALSRSINILHVHDESFEYVLAASQRQDPSIASIIADLEKQESSQFEMIDGLIYKKVKDGIRFYVPKAMEERVIQTNHEAMCHLSAGKCYDDLSRAYWFPNMRQKINEYIKTCLKCAYFSPHSGKLEGTLHNIPKGHLPFDTIHIDHYGPIAGSGSKYRYILVVIDGFTKFVKLYPVRATSSDEVIKCLRIYFEYFSRPNRIVSDRASCFTSREFEEFLKEYCIQHIKIATNTPQANGQVERVNRVLTTMLSKECEYETTSAWAKHLVKIEFALNNTINRGSGFSPSMLLFGVNQRGRVYDKVAEFILNQLDINTVRDLSDLRKRAEENIKKNQKYNKDYYDKTHKRPHTYKVGDYVMLKNNSTLSGVNKKLFSKFRGPYEIKRVLENDRYVVQDIDGMQISRIPYRGICSPSNMKPFYISVCDEPST